MFDFVNKLKDKGRWRIFKLKLIDARLYFVSIFVGLLTGLIAVPYHYLLQFFFSLRHDFFDAHLEWYWCSPLFLLMWGILIFVSWMVKKMPLITGGGIPQTRGVINGRVDYKHPFRELITKCNSIIPTIQRICVSGCIACESKNCSPPPVRLNSAIEIRKAIKSK